MKKILSILLIFVILINLSVQVFAQQNISQEEIKVYVNDTEISFDVSPFFLKSFTMVPVRAVFEALGAKVEWDNYTKTVSITRGTEVRVQAGNRIAMIDNVPYMMDVPAVGVDGRIMVPVRFISEAIGANVVWVNETKTIFINDLKEQKELGNLQNGGRFAVDNTYYYHILTDGVLVRENIITKQKEKISDNILCDLHIIGDWIYCIGYDKGISKVIRMKKDGAEKEVIVNKPVNSMRIINGWIYYSKYTDESILYRTKTDGTEISKIIDKGDFSSNNWFVQNGRIYYINSNQIISSARIDGSDIKNLTKRISSLDFSSANKIYELKLIDNEFLYVVINKNITDINRVQYTPGLYRIPIKGGEFTKITDKIPLSANMDDEWLYLTVEEDSCKLIRCKKDGTEVVTINEYKKNDIPGSIYLHDSKIFYTVIRGEETSEELMFYMSSYGDSIQQYSWIYGKDYYTVRKILTDAAAAYLSLTSFSTVQSNTIENENGIKRIAYESTINRPRSLFYKKTIIDDQTYFETWLERETLYSKNSNEIHWDIEKINKADAAKFQKSIFDYIKPNEELCNNLNVEETSESYILKGTGTFSAFLDSISPYLDFNYNHFDSIQLQIKINKVRKHIEELDLKISYNSDVKENCDIKQFTNHYHFANSKFNSVYLNIPYSVNQTIKAKENADKNTETGLARYNEGKYEEAIKFFDTAIGLYNKALNAYIYKGNSLYNLGKNEEAILAYSQYHEINPYDKEVFALMGMCYLNMGDLAKAEELGKETLKYSQSIQAYNLLGTVASLREEYRTAVEYFKKAVALDSKNYKSNLNLVSTLFYMGSYTECIETIDSFLFHFPDREFLYIKAQCLSNQGKSEQAIKVYESILASNPANDFVTMTYIAREYEILQDYQKAKEYADRAKAVYPDYNLLKYLIDKLDYNLSTTSSQKLVDFIKENYLFYEHDEDFTAILEKGDLLNQEDVQNLIDAVKSDNDDFTRLFSGYDYEFYFNNNRHLIDVKQHENSIHVKIKYLYPGTGVQFAEIIQSIEKPEEKTLILDLRDNNSGISDEANKILDALLPECTPSYVIDRNGYIKTYNSGKWHTPFHKIGILVNENTASSAELITLGLKTFADNVTIIGNKTAGRGVGQIAFLDRTQKFAILLVNHYWNVLQVNVEGKGIEADIPVGENHSDYTKAIEKFLNE